MDALLSALLSPQPECDEAPADGHETARADTPPLPSLPSPDPPGRLGGSSMTATAGPNALAPVKTRAAGLSIASNTFLILLKVIAGTVTGSVAILTEAMHSS